ncbi:MAG TPA: SIMPL domain-containing protein [Rhizomicrobium sp.]|jgi:hypothetical protein|nr:SIMPL domain-containing protein [Rhizomicrobium sp.]
MSLARFLTLASIGLLLAASPALADSARLLTVTGQGEVRGVPDEAMLTAGVVTTARTAAAALADNSRAMNRVFAALRQAGIPEKDIQTSQFSVQPQYTDASGNTPARLTGYEVTDTVAVVLDDLANLGATLDALVSSGANSAGDIAFTIRNPAPLAADARARAVADATARAQTLAKAAGVTLGPIETITDDGNDTPQPRMRTFMANKAMAGAPTPIARGEESVSASVTIVWEIR